MRYIIIIIFFIASLWSSALQLSISSSPSRINPLLATDSASAEVADYIFNGLVKFDKNGLIVADLAREFHFEDNKTLLFDLRKGVKWHDGHEFDNDDVIYTYKLLNSPKLVTPYKDDFKYVESVEKIGRYGIRVKYKQPYFKALSIWMMGILPAHLWKSVDDPMTSDLNKMPIGTGPYKMTKPFKVNERIVLESNEQYFIHAPLIKKINLHYIGDPSTQFITLKAKELDIGGLDPLQVERQIDSEFKSYYQMVEQPSNSYTYIGFNLRRDIFKDREVREAIALSIDRREMVDLLFFSHGTICNGPFMPKTSVYPKEFKPYEYNPTKAKEILSQLGYSSLHPLKFELVTNTANDTRVYAAQIIQHQLRKVGIEMTIRTMEWQAFLNTIVMPHNFDAVLLGWSLSLTPDAYSIWHSDGDKKGGFNFVGYHNSKVDEMIVDAEKIVDREKFAEIYRRLFVEIVDDFPYIFLYIPNSITAINRDIKNIEPSITGIKHNQIDWIKN